MLPIWVMRKIYAFSGVRSFDITRYTGPCLATSRPVRGDAGLCIDCFAAPAITTMGGAEFILIPHHTSIASDFSFRCRAERSMPMNSAVREMLPKSG